jgi:hypothetical protein
MVVLQAFNSVSTARFEIGLMPGADLPPPGIITADGPGKGVSPVKLEI